MLENKFVPILIQKNKLSSLPSRSFIVDNFQDRARLMELMRSVNCRVPIIVRRIENDPYDISSGKCTQYPTVLDHIIVKNETAFKVLVDSCKIEKIIIISTDDEAQDMMSDEGKVPKNCGKYH